MLVEVIKNGWNAPTRLPTAGRLQELGDREHHLVRETDLDSVEEAAKALSVDGPRMSADYLTQGVSLVRSLDVGRHAAMKKLSQLLSRL